MNSPRNYIPEIVISLICAALWVWFLVMLTAPPAGAQEQRCSVQTFTPPLESGWAMPGDADTVSIFFTDGTGTTLVGPFTLGDIITHPGQVAASIEKCTGLLPEPTPEPEVTPTPADPPVTPTPIPQPTPVPEATPVPEDQCCTTVVTPGPEPTPTVITPEPPTEPTPFTPIITQVGKPAPTPTPDVPTLPETGGNSGPLVVAALFALAVGSMLVSAARRG